MEQVLDVRVHGRYKLIERIGQGGFGEVFRGIDVSSEVEVAIKLEDVSIEPSILAAEVDQYRRLQRIPGIPHVYWYGEDCEYRALVFELLGPSLEDLFNFCSRRFSVKTVAMLAHQLLRRFRSIHGRGVVHRDIKPENILMGTGRQGNTIFVTDLGLAWSNEVSGVGPRSRGLMGTARFASIKAHAGEEQCARDDLESVGYMLVYFLRGSLPWQGLRATTDEEKAAKIYERKMQLEDETIVEDCPDEMRLYFAHLRSLGNGKKPDYAYLQRLFLGLMRRRGLEWDNVFDWTEKLHRAQASE